MSRIIAVIPAYNEESRLATAVESARPFVADIVVVDDCSGDETHAKASNLGVHVLRHPMNRGQGASLQTGTQYALDHLGADVVIHFDADGQMQGKDIPAMAAPILAKDAHVVLGSRFLGTESNMPTTRRMTLKLALVFTKLVSGIAVTDPHCGFRALSRHAANTITLRQDRMAHASEILDLITSSKLSFVSRPVEIRYTEETLAKGMGFLDGFTVVKDYFKHKFFDTL